MLPKADLFARLAEGHAAGITVVTPNKRLSQALMAEFDLHQKDLVSWEAPDILPFSAWVERVYEDALYSEGGDKLPMLLTPAQEQRLWEEIIAGEAFIGTHDTAARCRKAFQLLHAWRIGNGPGNEDALAFQKWKRVYEKRTAGDVDAARLPDALNTFVKKPKLVVAYAFDILPPQTRDFLAKFEWVECKPERVEGIARKTSYDSSRHELEATAAWARARLEEGKARIGVVVPQLGKRRQEIVRVFTRVLGTGKAFNVSLGRPLDDYPLVHAALACLELAHREVPFATASRFIRSPFLGGADSDLTRRARLDVKLRKESPSTVSLAKLIAVTDGSLRTLLERVFAQKGTAQTPSEWARHFSAVLEAAGFPGERALDSEEFQTRAKWHEVLGDFAKLERISRRLDFSSAFSILKRLCADTLFQPESGDAPIQVLGVLESAGARFDCLWVSGLTDEAWPLSASPNPFIPVALQKKAGVPEASAEASAELDRRLTAEWRGAAAEVVFSWPRKEEDRDLAASPLIRDVPDGEVAIPKYPRYRDLIFSAKRIATLEDAKGPPVDKAAATGGTRVLADQAACPFRAFARHRLRAEPLEEPAPGLDARDRGILIHTLMKEIWSRIKNSANLNANVGPAIAQAAEVAVREAGLEGRFAEIERARLARVAAEWLELEKQRQPFEIKFLEHQISVSVAGLELKGRIDRLDRLQDGTHALIDYKTGKANHHRWDGPRQDEPQMPLYALSLKEPVSVVAFAKMKTGQMRFMGFSEKKNVIPRVEQAKDWRNLLDNWRKHAEETGKAFAAGDARVDPKYDLKTCRECELQTLCRVYEKTNFLNEIDEE